MFGGSTAPKYFTDGVPSNIWGVYSPQIFDGTPSVKYLGGLQPQNISRKGFRQIFGGSTPPKYLTDGVASNIWGVYSPQIFHGRGSVKHFGGLHPPYNSRKAFRQIFGGSTAPKCLTDGVPSNIWGVYTPKLFDGWGSVKYLGGLHPQNISRKGFSQIPPNISPPKHFGGMPRPGSVVSSLLFLLVVCFCLITPFSVRVRVLPVRLLCAFGPQLPGSVRAIALRD